MANYVTNQVTMEGSEKDRLAIIDLLKSENPEGYDCINFNKIVPMPDCLGLVAGGYDKWFVAAYYKTLSTEQRAELIQKLEGVPQYPFDDSDSYFDVYKEAFENPIPAQILSGMEESFKKGYSLIAPNCIEDVGKAYVDNILNYGADAWYDWRLQNWGTKWEEVDCGFDETGFSFDTANRPSVPFTKTISKLFPEVTFTHEWADEDIGSNCGRVVVKNGEVIEDYLPEEGSREAIKFACDLWEHDPEEFGIEDADESRVGFLSDEPASTNYYREPSVNLKDLIHDAVAQCMATDEKANKSDKEQDMEI